MRLAASRLTIGIVEIAMDQFWQFGTVFKDGTVADWDVNTIWFVVRFEVSQNRNANLCVRHNDTEWQTLAVEHAKAMMKKAV